jgi:hypothetical protein
LVCIASGARAIALDDDVGSLAADPLATLKRRVRGLAAEEMRVYCMQYAAPSSDAPSAKH